MATVPVFRTWTAGEIVTAAFMNTNIRDAGNFLLGRPVAELRQAAAQSIATSAFVAFLLETEDLDTDNGHSTVTNLSRYTGATPGWYRFSGGTSYATNATGKRYALWGLNGTNVNGTHANIPAITGNPSHVAARTKHIQLNGTTDYVELLGFQDSGGALLTAVGGAEQPNMSVAWVRT